MCSVLSFPAGSELNHLCLKVLTDSMRKVFGDFECGWVFFIASLGSCLLFIAILNLEIVLIRLEYGTVHLKFNPEDASRNTCSVNGFLRFSEKLLPQLSIEK